MKPASVPDLGCACATIRRAARLVTALYDAELRGLLEASQFALLTALEHKPGCAQAMLGRALGLDKTTLSRNLRLLERNGWIERASADDLRQRGFVLTPRGRKLLKSARPKWEQAQRRLRSSMTTKQWGAMWQSLRTVAEAAHELRHRRGTRLKQRRASRASDSVQ